MNTQVHQIKVLRELPKERLDEGVIGYLTTWSGVVDTIVLSPEDYEIFLASGCRIESTGAKSGGLKIVDVHNKTLAKLEGILADYTTLMPVVMKMLKGN